MLQLCNIGYKIDQKYFYEFCFANRLRLMFHDYTAMGIVNMDDVNDLMCITAYPTITPRTALVELTGVSSKRRASKGDKVSGGGVSGTVLNHRKKTRCGHCGRPIAVDNRKHALSSACVAYASKHKTGTLYSANVIDVFNTSRSSSLYVNSDEEDTSLSAVVQYGEGGR